MIGTNTACRPSSLPSLRDRSTLLACHDEAIRRLAALPIPASLSVYDTRQELAYIFRDHVVLLRRIIEALELVFVRVADDAADFGGARIESFDLVRAAAEDFIAPITVAADELADSD